MEIAKEPKYTQDPYARREISHLENNSIYLKSEGSFNVAKSEKSTVETFPSQKSNDFADRKMQTQTALCNFVA